MDKEQIQENNMDVQSTINTFSRRKFLKAAGLLGVSTIVSVSGVVGLIKNIRDGHDYLEQSRQTDAKLDQAFPLTAGRSMDRDVKAGTDLTTSIEVAKQESRVEHVFAAEGVESAKQVIASPEYINAQIARAEYKNQLKERAAAYNSITTSSKDVSWVAIGSITASFGAIVFGGRSIFDAFANFRSATRQRRKLIQLLKTNKAIFYLPPVGGKIGPMDRNKLDIIEPSLTIAGQVEEIKRKRRKGELGDEYIHQMTVQGRLPDEFKLAALGLIISSPYSNRWEIPFYKALWGQVAPLVHDGGRVDTELNPLWRNTEHRTDFLHRFAKVTASNLEELESLSSEEKAKLPVDTIVEARAEQVERSRLESDTEFYQATALCCHAYLGTAPKEIPEKERQTLSEIWLEYTTEIKNLLCDAGVQEVYKVPWFLDEPRVVENWPNKRYEAEWPPIKEQLLKLEEARLSNLPIIIAARMLMKITTQKVHRTIGLVAA